MSDVGDILGGIIAGLLAPRLQARRAKRLSDRGQIPCGMRALEKTSGQMSSHWRNGTAAVQPGAIEFKAKGFGGTVVLPGPPVTIRVRTLGAGRPREPTFMEALLIPVTATIIVGLTTETGARLEWALPAQSLPGIVDRLGVPHDG